MYTHLVHCVYTLYYAGLQLNSENCGFYKIYIKIINENLFILYEYFLFNEEKPLKTWGSTSDIWIYCVMVWPIDSFSFFFFFLFFHIFCCCWALCWTIHIFFLFHFRFCWWIFEIQTITLDHWNKERLLWIMVLIKFCGKMKNVTIVLYVAGVIW